MCSCTEDVTQRSGLAAVVNLRYDRWEKCWNAGDGRPRFVKDTATCAGREMPFWLLSSLFWCSSTPCTRDELRIRKRGCWTNRIPETWDEHQMRHKLHQRKYTFNVVTYSGVQKHGVKLVQVHYSFKLLSFTSKKFSWVFDCGIFSKKLHFTCLSWLYLKICPSPLPSHFLLNCTQS